MEMVRRFLFVDHRKESELAESLLRQAGLEFGVCRLREQEVEVPEAVPYLETGEGRYQGLEKIKSYIQGRSV